MDKYQSYKPSGVEWIGEIPSSWVSSKLKFVLKRIVTGGTPDTSNDNYWSDDEDDGYNWISISDMTSNPNGIEYTKKRITNRGFESKRLELLPIETIIYSIYGSIGKVNKLKVESTIHQGILGLFPNFNIEGRYLEFYLRYIQGFINILSSSNTQENLNLDKVRNIGIILPPLSEQNQIVQFLDSKTELIDKLISTKERKITLLKEQRTSLINQVVTKGLNPNVKMKDSGVEWIGEIPEHWELKQLKYLIKNLNSGVSVNSENVPVEDEIEFGVLKTSCVYGDVFRPEENKKVVIEEINRVNCPVFKNTIIISRMNTPELVGSSGYVYLNYSNLFLPDRLWITEFKEEVDVSVKFYSYILKSDRYKKTLSSKSTGTSSSMKNISKNDLLSLMVPYFDLKEQIEITTYLDEFSIKNDDLVQLEQKKIDLLKEYRQSLISEVVTGKIKVTND